MSSSPIGDEAGRLWEALHQRFAGRAGGSLANGSPECCVCPVCQLISAARQARPEVVEHLAGAAAEAFSAFRALVDAAGAPAAGEAPAGSASGQRRNGRGVERIDLDE